MGVWGKAGHEPLSVGHRRNGNVMSSNGIVWPSGDGGRLLQNGIGCFLGKPNPPPSGLLYDSARRRSANPLLYGEAALHSFYASGLRTSAPVLYPCLSTAESLSFQGSQCAEVLSEHDQTASGTGCALICLSLPRLLAWCMSCLPCEPHLPSC